MTYRYTQHLSPILSLFQVYMKLSNVAKLSFVELGAHFLHVKFSYLSLSPFREETPISIFTFGILRYYLFRP